LDEIFFPIKKLDKNLKSFFLLDLPDRQTRQHLGRNTSRQILSKLGRETIKSSGESIFKDVARKSLLLSTSKPTLWLK